MSSVKRSGSTSAAARVALSRSKTKELGDLEGGGEGESLFSPGRKGEMATPPKTEGPKVVRSSSASGLRRSRTLGSGSLVKNGRDMVVSTNREPLSPGSRLYSKVTRPTTPSGMVSMADDELLRVPKKKVAQVDSLLTQATRFASKYRLEVFEVKNILEELDKADKSPQGSITMPAFRAFLCRVFGATSIPDSVLNPLHNLVNVDIKGDPKPFEITTFLDWYLSNIFTTVPNLKGDPKAVAARSFLANLCKKHDLRPGELDQIKKSFDKYDIDGSGFIDQGEFEHMLCALLNSKKSDMSADRLKSFWQEIDGDGSGEVDFEEFVQWYLKYFGGADGMNPTEAFYASFNPSTQRAEMLRKMQEAEGA